MKLHIISAIGWEYNDEYYYRPESHGGEPQKAYRDPAQARSECDRMNGEAMRSSKGMVDDDGDPCLHYEVIEINAPDLDAIEIVANDPAPPTLADLAKVAADHDAKLKASGKAAFEAALRSTFAAHPVLTAIRWTQYAPHFNDGEPCYFSVHEFQMSVAPPQADESHPEDEDEAEDEDEDEDGGGDFEDAGHWRYLRDHKKVEIDPAIIAAEQAVHDLNKQAEKIEAAMESIFGNGYRITARRDGTIDIEEYEHD